MPGCSITPPIAATVASFVSGDSVLLAVDAAVDPCEFFLVRLDDALPSPRPPGRRVFLEPVTNDSIAVVLPGTQLMTHTLSATAVNNNEGNG